MLVNVQNGTSGPRKRPLKPKPEPWSCCGRTVPGYWANCPECGGSRK